ncbi:MAG: CPBP family intramembrane metalloprotease [Acidobacteria bacterium]|nr:MAG: CPBP family intramembrane metalloprotease [Acidobacteriota bacterium]
MNGRTPVDELLERLAQRVNHPWARARWGALGALLLLVAVPMAWLLVGTVLTALFQAAGASLDSLGYRYAIVGATQLVLLAAAFGGAAAAGASPADLGLRAPVAGPALRGALLGGFGLLLALGWDLLLRVAWPEAAARAEEELARQMAGLAGPWPLLLAFAVIVAPLGEELFFRGFLFAGLRRVLSFTPAALVSAAAFAAVHLMPWSSPPLIAVGVLAAWSYERERTLAGPIALHAAFNGLSLVYSLVLSPDG